MILSFQNILLKKFHNMSELQVECNKFWPKFSTATPALCISTDIDMNLLAKVFFFKHKSRVIW